MIFVGCHKNCHNLLQTKLNWNIFNGLGPGLSLAQQRRDKMWHFKHMQKHSHTEQLCHYRQCDCAWMLKGRVAAREYVVSTTCASRGSHSAITSPLGGREIACVSFAANELARHENIHKTRHRLCGLRGGKRWGGCVWLTMTLRYGGVVSLWRPVWFIAKAHWLWWCPKRPTARDTHYFREQHSRPTCAIKTLALSIWVGLAAWRMFGECVRCEYL